MSLIPLADWRPLARGGRVRAPAHAADDLPSPLPAHVGLWLDRLYGGDPRGQDDDKEKPARRALYEAAIRALAPAGQPPAVQAYRPFFARWRASLEAESGLETWEIHATSRILLHPASNQSVTDGSLLLHHTYGVPYLPGSALKGLARRALERQAGKERARQLFGPDKDVAYAKESPEDGQGLVDFLDALWIPEAPREAGTPPDWSPLALDIVNPHHNAYYTGDSEKRPLPTDADAPVPTHRLSLAPGARFLLAVQWIEEPGVALGALARRLVEEVLGTALREEGIGAWTSAGYGRLELPKREKVASSRTAGRAAVPPPAAWQPAQVSRKASTGEIFAALADGRRASARGQEAADLLGALPPELHKRVRDGRNVSLEVQVEPLGRTLQVKALRPRGG